MHIPSGIIHLLYLSAIVFVLAAGWRSRSYVADLQVFSPLDRYSSEMASQANRQTLKMIKRNLKHCDYYYSSDMYRKICGMDSLVRIQRFNEVATSPELLDMQKSDLLGLMRSDMNNGAYLQVVDSLLLATTISPLSDSEDILMAAMQTNLAERHFTLDLASKISWDCGFGQPFGLSLISPKRVRLKNTVLSFVALTATWNEYRIRTGNHIANIEEGPFVFDTTFAAPGRYPLAVELDSWNLANAKKVNVTDTMWVDVLPR